ncbi:DUF4836 family protein [Ferruginibacter sp. HRS2-29]|uniref:DUF4836 family protein n=1 Tax=Ferruginibacter sp. HRS2-29 TaxID=2487334 RepID=UPI0020CDA21A|nr:DUF4836 family protein [Ferruginibacter sp. HRS2-29]MCP9752926.1 hypothetical protein [Ferruginibacter sp. HRS2-29]
MKKFFFALSLSCSLVTVSFAQDLLTKVPSNATVVIKYSKDNFGKSVPLTKLDSYGFIRNEFFKMLKMDTLTSMDNTGIDLLSDSYQYVDLGDSTKSFVTLIHLSDSSKFARFLNPSVSKKNKPEVQNGFRLISLSDETYVALNDKIAMIATVSYDDRGNYYDREYNNGSDSVYVGSDSVFVGDVEVVPPPPPPPAPKYKQPAKQKPVVKAAPGKAKTKPTAKAKPKAKPKPPRLPKPTLEDKIEEVTVETTIDGIKYNYDDSVDNVKREVFYQQQEIKRKQVQHDLAVTTATQIFSGNIASIANDVSYKKLIDPAAHVSIWMNSNDLVSQYSRFFSRAWNGSYRYPTRFTKDSLAGFNAGTNVYFENDKIRAEQKTFSADKGLSELGQSIMNSKQNPSLAGFVNPGNIGYLSMSVNTEAMANYYYRLIRQYLSDNRYMREYSDIVDIYIDFLEIAIDEKALAELSPGNFLFVMHDLKTKTVTYTDYSYDSEYNKTETKGTRKEISPDFSFVMETKKDAFMQKLAKLPLKYAEKEHYKYFDRGGYYELEMDSSDIIGNLYFMVKDGKALVTTSKTVVDLALTNKGFELDNETKKSILNNNYSMKLNSSRMLEKLSGEFTTTVNKKVTDYLIDNIGDVRMESSVKDGMIQSTTTMAIKGKHNNSLEFFFNMIDSINDIIEKDKQEKLNRVD